MSVKGQIYLCANQNTSLVPFRYIPIIHPQFTSIIYRPLFCIKKCVEQQDYKDMANSHLKSLPDYLAIHNEWLCGLCKGQSKLGDMCTRSPSAFFLAKERKLKYWLIYLFTNLSTHCLLLSAAYILSVGMYLYRKAQHWLCTHSKTSYVFSCILPFRFCFYSRQHGPPM